MMDRRNPITPDAAVGVAAVSEYDEDAILRALVACEESIPTGTLSGKRVVVKPNFVAKCQPDRAATVHPAVLGAVVRWLRAHGAESVTLAESPGGVYNAPRLRSVYSAVGAQSLAESHGIDLNFDCSFSEATFPTGRVCRLFDIITPILEADIIVDVCKLKTHALTGMSAAVKNLFGVVPGIVKFEMHSRYPDYGDFSEMLVDLCELLCQRSEIISITDGIVAMEGNGPTAGVPRHLDVLLVSKNPFASDAVAAHLIGRDGRIDTVNRAAARGLCPASYSDVSVIPVGAGSKDILSPRDFALPDSADKNGIEIIKNLFGGRIYSLFRPYPVVSYEKCVGCGECASSCPRHTINMVSPSEAKVRKTTAKRVPVIERGDCIRCFCCQELCPHGVVKIRKNPLTRWLS